MYNAVHSSLDLYADIFIGRTTIVIAHRLRTIENAHQIYLLDHGSLIEQGTHQSLMEKHEGKYQKMVRAQYAERGENSVEKIESKVNVESDKTYDE